MFLTQVFADLAKTVFPRMRGRIRRFYSVHGYSSETLKFTLPHMSEE
jgi:hypothetical protein